MHKRPNPVNETGHRDKVDKRLVLALVAVLAGGCTTTTPIDTWQEEVRRLTLDNDGLNLDEIRLLPERGAPTRLRPAPIIIGCQAADSPFASDRREAIGVLVDVWPHESREWLVFMLGIIRNETSWRYNPQRCPVIEDIRPVGLAFEADEPEWIVGPANPEALRRYSLTDRQGRSDDPGSPGLNVRGFPRVSDAFRITEAIGGLDLCEARTGACWNLPLPGPSSARGSPNGRSFGPHGPGGRGDNRLDKDENEHDEDDAAHRAAYGGGLDSQAPCTISILGALSGRSPRSCFR